MTLEELGYNSSLEIFKKTLSIDSLLVGRVVSEHRERYVVKTDKAEFDTEVIGNLRFTAESRYDFPAVGDWVGFSVYGEHKGLIHVIYPRSSLLERKAAGRSNEVQIMAANVDYGLIVQAVSRDFNLNRLERYLTICNSAKVKPVIVLSKTDLITETELDHIRAAIANRITDVQIVSVSNVSNSGYDEIKNLITKGITYCLLGSSGVGKSTLVNNLLGAKKMKTDSISESVNKGKHVTSHRELVMLEEGGILIDNPGMREVGLTDTAGGMEITFDAIINLSHYCKFKDCTHLTELGCAVLEALEKGELDNAAFQNYHKMQREKMRFETSLEEKHRKEKSTGKLYKHIINARKKNKY